MHVSLPIYDIIDIYLFFEKSIKFYVLPFISDPIPYKLRNKTIFYFSTTVVETSSTGGATVVSTEVAVEVATSD